MTMLNTARLIIYRINKKGLEVFLVNAGAGETEQWQIPNTKLPVSSSMDNERVILLEPVAKGDSMHQALAIEGDWHEIPSIRAMLRQDVRIVKDQIKQRFPELEQGTYFAVKEAVKKILPEEYAFLKELKEIVLDRNQAKYI